MKKALLPLLSAALLLFVAGCGGNVDPDDVVFPDPATKDQAVSIEFNQGEVLKLELPNRLGNSGEIVTVTIPQIDLSEANRYILLIDEQFTKANMGSIKAAWTGRYTFDRNANLYRLDGFGVISIKDKLCKIEPTFVKANLPSYEIPANIKKIITSGNLMANLCRTWKVSSVHIKVQGGKNNVNFSKGFENGCDLHEIGVFCKEKGVSLSDADIKALEGYKVSEILLEGNNNIIISFNAADAFYGTYSANGNSFSWKLTNSNQIIAANADGKVSFDKKAQTAELAMNTIVRGGGETYNAVFTFNLAPVN